LLTTFLELASIVPFAWWIIKTGHILMKEKEESRRKIAVLWKGHGYYGWDGRNRRKKMRDE
jgi:hypothetical protein